VPDRPVHGLFCGTHIGARFDRLSGGTMSLSAAGIAMAGYAFARLDKVAKRRNVSRSRLVNELLSKILPRLPDGHGFFDIVIVQLSRGNPIYGS
jgi:hypothetical protein